MIFKKISEIKIRKQKIFKISLKFKTDVRVAFGNSLYQFMESFMVCASNFHKYVFLNR